MGHEAVAISGTTLGEASLLRWSDVYEGILSWRLLHHRRLSGRRSVAAPRSSRSHGWQGLVAGPGGGTERTPHRHSRRGSRRGGGLGPVAFRWAGSSDTPCLHRARGRRPARLSAGGLSHAAKPLSRGARGGQTTRPSLHGTKYPCRSGPLQSVVPLPGNRTISDLRPKFRTR